MFKFKKLTNSAASIPEIRELDSMGCEIFEGALFLLVDGEPMGPYGDQKPEYVSLKNCDYSHNCIPCFKLSDNMVFETEFIGDPSSIFPGTKLMGVNGHNGYTASVKSCDEDNLENAIAEIYSKLDARKSGDKVLVTFTF